jgi:hypothetical protein
MPEDDSSPRYRIKSVNGQASPRMKPDSIRFEAALTRHGVSARECNQIYAIHRYGSQTLLFSIPPLSI